MVKIFSKRARAQLERASFPLLHAFKEHRWRQWIMPLSIVIHLIGYEAAKSASIALLSSDSIGLGQDGLSLTMTLCTPVNVVMLYIYAICQKYYGPERTLRFIHCIVVSALVVVTLMFHYENFSQETWKWVTVLFNIFRESYFGLLSTQQWGFILDHFELFHKHSRSQKELEDEPAAELLPGWVALVGGISSFASVCGSLVLYYAAQRGMPTLFAFSVACATTSWALTEYAVLQQEQLRGSASPGEVPHVVPHVVPQNSAGTESSWMTVVKDALSLLRSNRTVQLLVVEAALHQTAGAWVNLEFHNALRSEVNHDETRITLLGQFFAVINVGAFILQLLVLPRWLSAASLPRFLVSTPMLVLGASITFSSLSQLHRILLVFGVMKVLEYSVLATAIELVYIPMESSIRGFSKELVRFCGHKVGKTVSALAIRLLLSRFQPDSGMRIQWGFMVVGQWGLAVGALASHISSEKVQSKVS